MLLGHGTQTKVPATGQHGTKNTLTVALINLDNINNTHKRDKRK